MDRMDIAQLKVFSKEGKYLRSEKVEPKEQEDDVEFEFNDDGICPVRFFSILLAFPLATPLVLQKLNCGVLANCVFCLYLIKYFQCQQSVQIF